MKRFWGRILVIVCIIILLPMNSNYIKANAKILPASNEFIINSNSKPYVGKYESYSTYNNYTKNYYMIRSYLERLEELGGGTITLEAGTYSITNTLYVPSNVSLILKDGAVIKKGNKTGSTKITASNSIFQLVRPSKSEKSSVNTKYNGEHDINIMGEGTATIDLNNVKGAVAIAAGNNKNLTISGITFKNMYDGNFIRLAATDGIKIENNIFKNAKASSNGAREAIKLIVTDKKTGEWNYKWSKQDKTPNINLTIQGNTFTNLERAIGTVKYTENVYHTNVQVLNNNIDTIKKDPIRIINWKNPVVSGNTIKNVADGSGNYRGILASGAINPTFTNNTMDNVARAVQIMPHKNSGNGESYAITYNTLSEANKEALKKNVLTNGKENFVRINNEYNVFDKNTEKIKLEDLSIDKDFVITPNSNPYKNMYVSYGTYNEYTKNYYMIRSYLERLEELGGGSITLKAGEYIISNVLYVPSNVTIYFEDGVTVKKGTSTGTNEFEPSYSIFQLVRPSKAYEKGVYGEYNGEKNISFIGKGNVIIDLNYYMDSIAIIAGHNKNITIENITFQNMYSGHFIEMDATDTAVVKGNTFQNAKASPKQNKEAINLDTPDRSTEGWSQEWSKFDKTANRNIVIEGNTFKNLDRAVGTHKYSEGKLHENITIKDNYIDTTRQDSIRVMNWSNFIIENNTIKNVADGFGIYRGILVSGATNPIIKENTIENSARPIQFIVWKNDGPGSEYDIIYNTITDEQKDLFKTNKLINVGEEFVRINYEYNVYDKNTEIVYITDDINEFIINSNSKPYAGKYESYSTYNNYTKDYYIIRSYLERLEELGGGTITLEAGTYSITNTLYVPSNVSLILKDGVVIKKGNKTGSEKITASSSIFQLVSPSKSEKSSVNTKYNGEHDINIIGEGTATIDLSNVKGAVAIASGNNKNLTISGITFKNMYDGNFIRLAATDGVKIENNIFKNAKASNNGAREAIKLIVTDKTTGEWNYKWSKQDKTPNINLTIQGNTFTNLERAIGTVKYTENVYHTNVQVLDNNIDTIKKDPIRIINWKNSVVSGNTIKNVADGSGNYRGILASGAINPTFTNNTMDNVARAVQIMPHKNSGNGESYAITYNTLSEANKEALKKNVVTNGKENFIRINNEYDVFDKNTEKIKLNLF